MTETLELVQKKGRRKPARPIPDCLIYEIVDGKPIYCRGYKDVLNNIKTFEETIT